MKSGSENKTKCDFSIPYFLDENNLMQATEVSQIEVRPSTVCLGCGQQDQGAETRKKVQDQGVRHQRALSYVALGTQDISDEEEI